MTLPIACTLTSAELTAMRGGLRRFDPAADLVKEIAAVIEAERRCCRFLRFLLRDEPDEGPVSLEVTGPEGTEDFLSTLVDSR